MDRMVIIGAGECGTRAAFALRENGWDGAITLIGAEHGLPYERPPLSKPDQAGVPCKLICTGDALRGAGIDYHPGVAAQMIDPKAQQVVLTDGRVTDYHRLLLATGARPRRLTCPGADLALDFRTHTDAEQIFSRCHPGARVAIVGAGLIGMELAAVLNSKGVQVAVVEAGAAALGRAVPPHLAARLYQRHCDSGVQFRFNATLTGIDAAGLTLSDSSRVAADVVIAAIGVVPQTDLAQGAGLVIGNGIQTDQGLRSSDAHIFAAGDCAAVMGADGQPIRHESWRSARDQAELAARNMMGAAEALSAQPWFWSDQFDLGLQVTGRPSPDHHMVRRILSPDAELAFYLLDGRLVAAAGLGSGNSVARDIKLAEMLIAAGICPDPAALGDPAVSLKALLRTARAA